MTTLAQALAAALSRHADQAFCLMGNGNAHLIDALSARGVKLSEVRHEAATVASADAYTRITDRIAIATTTYGAGFTNTLTALAEAAQARTPLLLVVGDEPSQGPRPWDIDQEMAAAALGVRTYTLSTENIDELVDRVVASALRRRSPVVLSLPYDLVNAEVTASKSESIDLNDPATMRALAAATLPAEAVKAPRASSIRPETAATTIEISAAVQLLARAERPVVLAGRGAWISGAAAELNRIATTLGALTATTALSRGIFEEERFNLGITGGFGQEAAMHTLGTADVVLVVGASLNQFTMRFGDLFGEGTKIVRIDADQVASPKTNHQVEQLLLRGDARDTLVTLNNALATARTAPSDWRNQISGLEPGGALRVRDTGSEHPDGLCEDGLLDPRAVAAKIGQLLPEDRHVTSDGGHFLGWANMFWPVASPERMVMVGTAYQTIGLGFATVAGVAAAAPESTAVLSTGDGGGLMALADLETTIRTAQSCVVVVWNDGAYSAEVHLYGLMGIDTKPMLIPDANFAGLASALGATGVRVETLSDLDALADWNAAGARGTILLDCRISRSVVAPYQREIQRVNGLKVD